MPSDVLKSAAMAVAATSPRASTSHARRPPNIVRSTDELSAALANRLVSHIVLAKAGSPYQLSADLRLSRDVIVEGEKCRSGERVEVVGRAVLSAGQLRSLALQPPRSIAGAASSSSAWATVEILPRSSGDGGRSAVLHDVWISPQPGSGISTSTTGAGIAKPSSAAVGAPIAVRASGEAAAAAASGIASGAAAIAPAPALALRVCPGAKGAVVSFCRLSGGVLIGEKAAPLLQSNEICDVAGPGVTMRGTSLSCELRDNTIRGSGQGGVLFVANAAGTLADNRILGSAGAGIEVADASNPLVLRNEVADAGGVGLLVRDGGRGDFRENVVVRAWAGAAELVGEGTDPSFARNKLLECRSGVGVLIHDGASGKLEGNEVSGHPLAGLEVGARATPLVAKNTISKCGGCGILIAAEGGGTISGNTVSDNKLQGIECCSNALGLVLEANSVSGHTRGGGVLIRAGGGGKWIGNTISGNAVGVEVGAESGPCLLRNKIHGNAREGVLLGEGSRASVIDCHVRNNGNGRLVGHERRGTRLHGDDAGAGIVVHAGAEATLRGNQISTSAGVGLFVHDDAKAVLTANKFHGNRGDAVAGRPRSSTELSEADIKCKDHQRAVTPAVVRRQRVPFDWTVGSNVSADDKSLAERVAEMREQYEASGTSGGLMMLPDGTGGADPSVVCTVQ